MGFFKKLFGSEEKKSSGSYEDKTGIYFYFQCDNCGTRVQVRAHKQNDLLSEGDGYVWHKTVVDSKCFRRMQTVVYLDRNYAVTSYELTGGQFLSQAEYEAAERAATAVAHPPAEEADTSEENTKSP